MALAETKYVVFSERELNKRATENLPQSLRRWLVECPQCAEVRLVVGARDNEPYVCKDCGESFNIELNVDQRPRTRNVR
jgi:transcription elongation factor Elf1